MEALRNARRNLAGAEDPTMELDEYVRVRAELDDLLRGEKLAKRGQRRCPSGRADTQWT